MGLLKHFVLPLFAVTHFMSVYTVYFSDRAQLPIQADWPPNSIENIKELTLYENVLLGIVACFHTSFLFGCVVGIVMENSHFRGVFAVMEMIMWGVGGIDVGKFFGYEAMASYSSFILCGIAAIGLVVHMNEPGIFTKDKTTTSSTKKD